eukprot:TRINITY_DN1963_c0_g1_i1.p1 TRINITY_DN1963_c0_g1~~TRINITY_DN1963_c0_g1_i1.p1  ORF type:complete len:179 (-),score=60.86 TRINITY_DN1963_c0_g1_i1:67-603(-)
MDAIHIINAMSKDECLKWLSVICGSSKFGESLESYRPFSDPTHLYLIASQIFHNSLSLQDKLDALAAHPAIGDVKTVTTADRWQKHSRTEMDTGLRTADEVVLEDLARYNKEYSQKFGRVYVIMAEGRSAAFMLSQLKRRMQNSADAELAEAIAEEERIVLRRLEKYILSAAVSNASL